MLSPYLAYVQSNYVNLFAPVFFIVCFRGYLHYTYLRSLDTPCLAFAMHRFRKQWIRMAMIRDNRIPDTNIVANLERNVSFFASTSLLVLAGLVTLLSSAEAALGMLNEIPFSDNSSRGEWEVKVLLLVFLFVYAFFKFTWALRQYGLVSVMIGAAPENSLNPGKEEIAKHVDSISKMASKASGNFNNGLRSYYFSMAALGWFINAWVLIALSVFIVFILYRREFKSDTLGIMMDDLPDA
ncbi:MAG: DUF599 domain-containing protein [Pseudohongiella sp.]|nr:DUF599 domain-containing protein [Pseudohongiella sp.]MDO9519853.1 DUF599 domain-containing protein [Pseudohongiella sp.]MDP2126650.1 DUF599 domain-containing protein [Pseudohongiella sp.]